MIRLSIFIESSFQDVYLTIFITHKHTHTQRLLIKINYVQTQEKKSLSVIVSQGSFFPSFLFVC